MTHRQQILSKIKKELKGNKLEQIDEHLLLFNKKNKNEFFNVDPFDANTNKWKTQELSEMEGENLVSILENLKGFNKNPKWTSENELDKEIAKEDRELDEKFGKGDTLKKLIFRLRSGYTCWGIMNSSNSSTVPEEYAKFLEKNKNKN